MTDPRPDSERMQRLEESQGFTERAMDELSEEVRALGKRVLELDAKLARLAARMEAARDSEEDSSQE